MIHLIVTGTCVRGDSAKIVRNHHDDKGSQPYGCKDCGRCGTR